MTFKSARQKPFAMSLTSDHIKAKAYELGFHLVGIAPAQDDPEARDRLNRWLERGYQGSMAWMASPRRQKLTAVMPAVQSVISVGINYYTPYQRPEGPDNAKVSRYGWGRDYHKILNRRLKALSRWLQEQVPQIQTRYYVDTGPVADKVWAEKAGLGWIAKNGNLINRQYGSWVFLGEVLTDLSLTPDQPHTAHCGTCTRCIEACPTNAITEPSVIDATRCIAYHTLENRDEEIPAHIDLAGWVAGCDICQDVCPWNQRFAQETDIVDFAPYPAHQTPKLTELAHLTEAEWDRRLLGSPWRRIKPYMWRRNARANLRNNNLSHN
ncbi:MAG: tRNA epoxyqueuosine(34) reductase QueG [Cyanobacteria bacterium P01_H01_bin.15]